MGSCDAGRCCKGSACTDDRKCCCQAKKGTFAVGEVCRSASCDRNGSCDNNVPICECLASGGSLAQSCDPCDNVVCGKCQQCVNGVCVSTCGICQQCNTGSINGTCEPKECGFCQTCVAGECVSSGVVCGEACCSFSQCCVAGACVSCDCTGQLKPGPCYECQSGQYQPILGTACGLSCCAPGLACCNGVCCPAGSSCSSGHCCPAGKKWCGSDCRECCITADCPAGKVCSGGVCVTPVCCIYEPPCAPGGHQTVGPEFPCADVEDTYCDCVAEGAPCTQKRRPVVCAESACAYEWYGSWVFYGCVVKVQGQDHVIAGGVGEPGIVGCGCTGAGCPAEGALELPGEGAYDGMRVYFGNCANVSNPLP